MNYTQGPWEVIEDNKQLEIYGGDEPVCMVYKTGIKGLSEERREANARLIAASPEMRNALSLAIRTIHDCLRHHITPDNGAYETLERLVDEDLKPALQKTEERE